MGKPYQPEWYTHQLRQTPSQPCQENDPQCSSRDGRFQYKNTGNPFVLLRVEKSLKETV
jgi:hypothetical protein